MPYIESVCGYSEMLLKRQKTSRRTTGNSIINEYGASELDLIFSIQTQKQKEWEINSETLFVEILDDKGAVLPYGKGRIVITSYSTKPIRLFVMILAILGSR
jgi:phenylacetate-CoA ligase